MIDAPSFLGRGWAFPPEFSQRGTGVEMVAEVKDIKQSLEILFGTHLGERIMQEGYGASLIDYQFEEISFAVINQLKSMVEDAILYHEPRIKLNEVKIDPDRDVEGLLRIQLDFDVPASNSRFNMVYPFYLKEANI